MRSSLFHECRDIWRHSQFSPGKDDAYALRACSACHGMRVHLECADRTVVCLCCGAVTPC
jgi:cytochrome c553